MCLVFEKSVSDGIFPTLKLYAKAIDKYEKDQYNPDETSIYLNI